MRVKCVPAKARTQIGCGRSGQLIKLLLLHSSARSSSFVRTVVTTPLLQLASTADDLAYWMSKFVLEDHRSNGDKYLPKSLYSLVCCFKHYFEDNAVYNINLLNPSTRNLIIKVYSSISIVHTSEYSK